MRFKGRFVKKEAGWGWGIKKKEEGLGVERAWGRKCVASDLMAVWIV